MGPGAVLPVNCTSKKAGGDAAARSLRDTVINCLVNLAIPAGSRFLNGADAEGVARKASAYGETGGHTPRDSDRSRLGTAGRQVADERRNVFGPGLLHEGQGTNGGVKDSPRVRGRLIGARQAAGDRLYVVLHGHMRDPFQNFRAGPK